MSDAHAAAGAQGAPVAAAGPADAALAPLGIRRLAIPVPFPEAGGPANVYLIDNPDGSLTLFDAGLGTEDARAALVRGFEEVGRRLDEVRQVVVSHGHVDHFGSARFVAERSGAQVLIHPNDAPKVLTSTDVRAHAERYRAYLASLGVPETALDSMKPVYRMADRFAQRLERVAPVQEGARFTFARFEAEVLHMPGHTSGLVCLWSPQERLLFSDDHLLARVSPNPVFELGPNGAEDKFRALEAYLASARRLHAMEIQWVLPGHGEPFRGHRERLDSLFAFYRRRQRKMLDALSAGPRSAWQILERIFEDPGRGELFLMMSEIIGNLEVLEAEGAVRQRAGSRPLLWERASAPVVDSGSPPTC